MSKPKTSAEVYAAVDEMKAKLWELRKQARRMQRLEQQREAEAQRQRDMQEALELIEISKSLAAQDGITYYEILRRELDEQKEREAAASRVGG